MPVQNTLDLDPEWGANDLIKEVEAVFGIEIANSDAARCETIGDVYDVLCTYVPDWDDQNGTCGSSAVFYRFRRALALDDRRGFHPGTPLADFGFQPKILLRRLAQETELRLPEERYDRLGKAGSYLLAGGMMAAIVAILTGHWMIAGAAFITALAGIPLIRLDSGRFPAGVETVGDLVRRTAPLNVEHLRAVGARPADRWSVLVALAAEHGTLPACDISPDTFLHQASLKKRAASQ